MISIVTGEFVLKFMPNGGRAVLIRASYVSVYLYLVAIAIRSYTGEYADLSFSLEQLRAELHETIPWFGAIFGAIYAALYARFSSQWSYLADLYNQQLALASTASGKVLNGDNYAIWQAAFIEDAVCMHLATKRGFSNAIYSMLQEKKIRDILDKDGQLGKVRVERLEAELAKICAENPLTRRSTRTPQKRGAG